MAKGTVETFLNGWNAASMVSSVASASYMALGGKDVGIPGAIGAAAMFVGAGLSFCARTAYHPHRQRPSRSNEQKLDV